MNHHIFIVDDDQDELMIFKEAFAQTDFNIKCSYADSADYALQYLSRSVPDFIFLDLNMPKTDGYECLKQIKERPHLSKAHVILFSTGMTDQQCAKGIRMGAHSCYKKPSDVNSLAEKINHILGRVKVS